ncbi:MAG: excinuclease ABC subunit UvrA, partial [Planctomycetaceae bacterium]|nr:excinuclease ABC subunit UvrA [Planctomycetaceae bacterium]
VYLLDEPTTGLHFADVHKLLEVLHNFVDEGNTVIVIEHNLDVIKTADWVIDIGPEGGAGGGTIVAEGTPEDVARCTASHTGQALRSVLPGMKPRKSRSKKKEDVQRSDPFAFAERIQVTGASQHNLQHISLQVPRNQMNVFCGPSGSGKTSLAMDTLYAEGQRRYVESLSAYARQFLGQMPKPRVDSIQGLSPAIAIEQKTVGATPRSTVGTVTEVYDYLRVLYARLGSICCPECQVTAEKQTTDEIVERILSLRADTRALLLAPVEVDRTVPFHRLWERLQGSGFVRVRVDGQTYALDEVPEMDHRRRHEVAVVLDRVSIHHNARGRIADSIEAALELGRGIMHVALADPKMSEPEWTVLRYSLHLSCPSCHQSFEQPAPQKFSFNSPLGWCPACEGLGTEYGANQSLLVTSPERSLMDGAIGAWPDPRTSEPFRKILTALLDAFSIPGDQPWYLLTPQQQRWILHGDQERWVDVRGWSSGTGTNKVTTAPFRFRYRGIYPSIELASRLSYSHRRSLMEMGGERDCSLCSGTRLKPVPAAVRLREVTLPQLCRMPLERSLSFLRSLKLSKPEKQIAGDLLNEAVHRLAFLVDVGLNYLTLDRGMPTLSGGESQRIRLAGQIGRSLTGVLYVLDEPTIGLHPRDNGRLLSALKRLRDLGNTVILVEHDREVLDAADQLFDFGPGAGRLGGNVIATGSPSQLKQKNSGSLTGQYLSGAASIPVPEERRIPSLADGRRWMHPGEIDAEGGTVHPCLSLLGASQHNLQNVDLHLPLGTLTCITGVSGSGKSSLIMDTLARAVARRLNLSTGAPGPHRDLIGVEHLSKIVIVDQNP